MVYSLQKYIKSKDHAKSPFRYPGGKFYALKHLIPFLEAVPHDEYREPFVGGGSVFFAKPKSKLNWINDLEGEIINVYEHFQDPLLNDSLASTYLDEIATKERHKEVINWEPSTELERAARTYYLNRTSYSGIIHKPAWGYRIGKSSPPQNWANFIKGCLKKMRDTRITSIDFEEVILEEKKGDVVLMYLDPPYFNADQKRAYTKSFNLSDHKRLAKLLKTTNHFFCLSYDDCAEVREMYKWANLYERNWLYNTANINGSKRITGNELVITNYEVSLEKGL
jgi:DNA adenine methylase